MKIIFGGGMRVGGEFNGVWVGEIIYGDGLSRPINVGSIQRATMGVYVERNGEEM